MRFWLQQPRNQRRGCGTVERFEFRPDNPLESGLDWTKCIKNWKGRHGYNGAKERLKNRAKRCIRNFSLLYSQKGRNEEKDQ